MNRKEIKEKSKTFVKENFKEFWSGYAILLLISLLLNFGIGLLFEEESMIYMALSLLISCFSMTLSVGFYSYLLKMIRKEEYSREDIFKFIGKVLPILSISILVAIFCILWGILFIIPGIIAGISYSFVYLLYTENQEKLPMNYLEESKELINGYKLDYFIFNLSFVGWMLLSIVTCGILLIWTIPYIIISQVLYYDELKKIKSKNVDKLEITKKE